LRKKLIILGTSGLAREMAMLAEQINAIQQCWDLVGFIGEAGCEIGKDLGFGVILGDDTWLLSQSFEADLVAGVGYPGIKQNVLSAYIKKTNQFQFPNLIHPTAIVDNQYVQLGQGNVITAGCIFTCNISVKDFNLFNWNVTVGHDASIGSFNVINPGSNISGYVTIGDRVLVGTGSQILERLHVESDVTIGAGAVVTKNIGAGETVVGIPAKPLAR
jgi:sugar O-acyltransferase (sialic acid O-acetyltransferase NeuD family)